MRHALSLLALAPLLVAAKGPGFPWLFFRPYHEPIPLSDDDVDTTGSVRSTTPDWVIAPDPKPLRISFTFTAGEDGVSTGGGLKVTLGHVLPTAQRIYTPFSLTVTSAVFFGIDYLHDVEVHCSDPDVKLDVVEPKPGRSFRELLRYVTYKRTAKGKLVRDGLLRQIDNEFALRVVVMEGRLKRGDRVDIVIGANDGLPPPKNEASWQIVTRLDGDGDGKFGLLRDAPSFDAYSTDTEHVSLVAPATLYPDETGTARLRTTDDAFLPNLTRFAKAEVTFEATPGIEVPERVELVGRDGEWVLGDVAITARQPGIYRLRGRAVVDGKALPVLSNPIEVVPAGTPKVYFGDLHTHSILSYDADRTPEYVWWRQRVEERHDFAALTDHDMIGAVPFARRDGVAGRTPDEWFYAKRLADEYDAPGEFVALVAYEWTSYWFGHRNVIFGPDEKDPPLVHHNQPADHPPFDEHDPIELRDELAGHTYLAIPHSTAWPTRNGPYTWGGGASPAGTALGDPDSFPEERELELYSTHGASEHFDNESAVDAGHREIPTDSKLVAKLLNYDIRQAPAESGNFARDALARGWKMGFVGASDDHYLSHLDQAYKYGLAAVEATELTRAGIWNALHDRRSYAVTGARILLHFSADGRPMGSEIPWGEEGPLALHAEVHGTGPLDWVEVARWDGAAWTPVKHVDAGGDLDLAIDVEDPVAKAGAIYYLRVRQQDGNRAWSSPVWLVRADSP